METKISTSLSIISLWLLKFSCGLSSSSCVLLLFLMFSSMKPLNCRRSRQIQIYKVFMTRYCSLLYIEERKKAKGGKKMNNKHYWSLCYICFFLPLNIFWTILYPSQKVVDFLFWCYSIDQILTEFPTYFFLFTCWLFKW